MTTPIVTEITKTREAVGRDTFISTGSTLRRAASMPRRPGDRPAVSRPIARTLAA